MSSKRTLRVRPTKAHPSFGSRARAPPETNRSTAQRPRARPQPIAPLPLPPATVPAAQLLARLFPDADDEARQASLDNTIRSEGSREAGLAYCNVPTICLNTCPVEGASLPPAGVALRSIDIGPHTIFYHPTYPAEMQADRAFTWSFTLAVLEKDGEELIFPADPCETPVASHQLA
ncbi:hypothetical protein B0H14DRAFT_2827788 [Mycena olivaceomarginata]|nr:hypothetical protein B0H14DRAFT_2827788 [Mycena olivaceomarginata]